VEEYLQAILTVLSLINPVVCAVIFKNIVGNKSSSEQVADATRVVLVLLVILCLAAVVGLQILKVFGIDLDVFQVAGGLVLAWMGFLMLGGSSSPTTSTRTDKANVSLGPLVLFAASPGTIIGVITLSVAHTRSGVPMTALLAVGVALTVTWLTLILAARSADKKQGLIHDISTRFMGLIVLAMGTQFLLGGLKSFFA
jgi:multiple antibiotic resistance protein